MNPSSISSNQPSIAVPPSPAKYWRISNVEAQLDSVEVVLEFRRPLKGKSRHAIAEQLLQTKHPLPAKETWLYETDRELAGVAYVLGPVAREADVDDSVRALLLAFLDADAYWSNLSIGITFHIDGPFPSTAASELCSNLSNHLPGLRGSDIDLVLKRLRLDGTAGQPTVDEVAGRLAEEKTNGWFTGEGHPIWWSTAVVESPAGQGDHPAVKLTIQICSRASMGIERLFNLMSGTDLTQVVPKLEAGEGQELTTLLREIADAYHPLHAVSAPARCFDSAEIAPRVLDEYIGSAVQTLQARFGLAAVHAPIPFH